jgi:hypothetical protein
MAWLTADVLTPQAEGRAREAALLRDDGEGGQDVQLSRGIVEFHSYAHLVLSV